MAEEGADRVQMEDSISHWQVFRDLVFFQFKLLLDGVRDLVLSPISIAAVVLGFILHPATPGRYFNQLLGLGHKSDKWINLFGSVEGVPREGQGDEDQRFTDDYLRRLEGLIQSEYEKGGLLKDVKERVDRLLTQKIADESPKRGGNSE